MKKIRTICYLLVALYAGEASAVLEAVIVSGIRAEQSSLNTPASINVITREQIEASGAKHIADLLRGQATIQISDRVGDGSGASISMRGFGDTANGNTLVLVDGRKLNNNDIAPPDLNSIPIQDVERIEIINGSAGVLFGDQAVGGVINIITRTATGTAHRVDVTVGSYARREIHASTSGMVSADMDYRVSADVRRSDNYRDHNEIEYSNLFAKLRHTHDDGHVFGEFAFTDDRLNVPGGLFSAQLATDRRQVGADFVQDFSQLETRMLRVGADHAIDDDWTVLAELTDRRVDGEFRLSFTGSGPSPNIATQDREVTELTPRIVGVVPALNDAILTLGYDQTDSNYDLSSVIGKTSNDQLIRSLHTQLVIPAGDAMDVTLGMRYAEVENELIDDFDYAGGADVDDDVSVATLGLAYQLDQGLRLLLRIDENYRFAKVDEYTLATPFGAPQAVVIKTQTGRSVEAGAEWSSADHHGRVLAYDLALDDEIAFDFAQGLNINLDETSRQGLTLEDRWTLRDDLDVQFSLSTVDAKVTAGVLQGKSVPYVAKRSGRLAFDYRPLDNWQFYLETTAIASRVLSGDFDNNLASLPGYGVTDAQVRYVAGDMSLSLRIDNLFDREYTEYGVAAYAPVTFVATEAYYPSPERHFSVTASWQFE